MFRSISLFVAAVCIGLACSSSADAQFSALFGKRTPIQTISAEQVRQLQTTQTATTAEKRKSQSPQESRVLESRTVEKPSFILVDVRSRAEQSVSMIPGAITAEQFEKHQKQFQGQTVITYCTSGVRSERFARNLASAGVQVLNFKGSILAWCAAQFPLVTPDGKPTTRVHTYSSRNRVPSQYTAVY